jgi:FAD synthetase
VYIRVDEASITGVLNDANAKFKDRVVMGSYPEFYNSYYKVKLCLESVHRTDLEDIFSFLRANLPPDSILDYEKDPILQAASRVYALAAADAEDDRFAGKIRRSLSIVEDCFNRYGADEVCVGFNGGKDCTALLHLVHAVVTARAAVQPSRLTALYIRHGQPFPEVELFISKCRESYGLDLVSVSGRIKDALVELRTLRPRLKAVLMGTRHTDPCSERLQLVQAFSPTDEGWPEYMRVNPMLGWTHADLWAFMRRLSLPYCPLYDRGYTSLGSMENTHPNPGLRVIDSRGVVSYRPAHTLSEGQDERAGRN